MENLDLIGEWWLPKNPDEKISGRLSFSGIDFPRLELDGGFDGEIAIPRQIILGISSDGILITLLSCYPSGGETGFNLSGSFQSSVFIASMVFVGHCFERVEDIRFKKMRVSYDHLKSWFTFSEFVSSQDPIKELVDEKIIRFVNSLEDEIYIEIEVEDIERFETFKDDILYRIQDFISLGVGIPIYPTSVQGATSQEQKWIKVFYFFNQDARRTRMIHPREMPFCFQDIRLEWQKFLIKWFKSVKRLKFVYNSYFDSIYAPRMYIRNHFLNLTQAIEGYHRLMKGGKISFRERLEKILQDLPTDITVAIIPKSKSPKDFVTQIKEYRNNLTHIGEKEEVISSWELLDLVQRLRFLLELCFLRRIGFSDERLIEIVKRCVHLRIQSLPKVVDINHKLEELEQLDVSEIQKSAARKIINEAEPSEILLKKDECENLIVKLRFPEVCKVIFIDVNGGKVKTIIHYGGNVDIRKIGEEKIEFPSCDGSIEELW